jgi:hypothetical protein
MQKNSHHVIPKGGVCPRNLLFPGTRKEKQIPRFARDDKQFFSEACEAATYEDYSWVGF